MTRLFFALALVAAAVIARPAAPTTPRDVRVAPYTAVPPRPVPTAGARHGSGTQRPLPAAGMAPPVPDPRPAADTCTSSWYGEALRGALTASGVPFDPDRLTAASWHHDFGTVLEVTAVDTGRTVEVVVTDRGPARHLGRCIDLARAAYERLADLSTGLLEVTVTEVPA